MKKRTSRSKKLHLNNEEKDLLASVERGEWRSAPNAQKILKTHSKIFRDSLRKNRHINIRMTESDLNGIRAKAIEEGIPYQTLMASILHKYVTGKLSSKP